jgi:hypothetical protein
MRVTTIISRVLAAITIAAGLMLSTPTAFAHCDTLTGPVVTDARLALQKGDVTPVLKWIRAEYEAEIRSAFGRTTAVRALGAEARDLADRYFFETVVRLHRAGEGEPYAGLKDTAPDPIIVLADQALTSGSANELTTKINGHLAKVIAERFKAAADARTRKDASVEAGRAFVEAYVNYTHYLEVVHTAIAATAAHQHDAKPPHAPRP